MLAAAKQPGAGGDIQVIELTDAAARSVISTIPTILFSELAGGAGVTQNVMGRGDTLEVTIWESPPAALFAPSTSDPRSTITGSSGAARGASFPEQVIDDNGRITLPFVGSLLAAGRSVTQLEREIVARLTGQAHRPQAIVRRLRNASANVTVVGDVASSTRMPLTPKQERLLDALASAGGVRQAVDKTTIQITRGPTVATLPLETIIRDPAQNVILQADDIVTALFQPHSFIALGAVTNTAEIPFEATGITVAQALGRMGGLRDERADIRGVFIFRLEDPVTLGSLVPTGARTTPDGKIPVIYRLSLKDPSSFFVAQAFPIRNRDVVYVSNAPITDIQKFVNIVSSMAFSIIGIKNGL